MMFCIVRFCLEWCAISVSQKVSIGTPRLNKCVSLLYCHDWDFWCGCFLGGVVYFCVFRGAPQRLAVASLMAGAPSQTLWSAPNSLPGCIRLHNLVDCWPANTCLNWFLIIKFFCLHVIQFFFWCKLCFSSTSPVWWTSEPYVLKPPCHPASTAPWTFCRTSAHLSSHSWRRGEPRHHAC